MTLPSTGDLTEPHRPQTRDYFAEMYVAGLLADAQWNVYFPRRDKGFDMIATKRVGRRFVLRLIQVKGKYPTRSKTDKKVFGFIGELTETHESMVLVLPFFTFNDHRAPVCIAWMPCSRIKQTAKGYACQPARFVEGVPLPRRDFAHFFDAAGLKEVEAEDWGLG